MYRGRPREDIGRRQPPASEVRKGTSGETKPANI